LGDVLEIVSTSLQEGQREKMPKTRDPGGVGLKNEGENRRRNKKREKG